VCENLRGQSFRDAAQQALEGFVVSVHSARGFHGFTPGSEIPLAGHRDAAWDYILRHVVAENG
jgi:predicted PhzF superfamily epimerase YddE/YHI9